MIVYIGFFMVVLDKLYAYSQAMEMAQDALHTPVQHGWYVPLPGQRETSVTHTAMWPALRMARRHSPGSLDPT